MFVRKSLYRDSSDKELGNDNSLDNHTYAPMTLAKELNLDNRIFVFCSCGIATKDEELDLPSID